MPASGQLIVGHRGASHQAPENTLAAFELAWQEGADGAEGDFRLTSDGHIVCMHDEDTKRTGDRNLSIANSTLDELRTIDVGSWKDARYAGERIATLSEVLRTVPEDKRFFIELKTGPEIVEPLQQVLADSPVDRERLVVIAFDDEVIRECKRAMPELRAHWLTSYKRSTVGKWKPGSNAVLDTLRRVGANGLGSKAEPAAFNTSFIDVLKQAGLGEFHVWTVDDPDLARFYIDQGAYSITTNRPGWLREQLGDALH